MLCEDRIFTGIPRVRLFEEPSPLQEMCRIEKELGGGKLYVKRDDCLPLGMGGNKIRSLEFWLGQAKMNNCDVIVVAGSDVSNQCRLAAAAAAKVGIDCLILHSSEKPPEITGNLLLNYLFGAEIRFIGRMDEKERLRTALETMESLRSRGRTPYLIGEPVAGACGYISGAFELYRQNRDNNGNIRHVFIPGSMGTTEAGFIVGNALLGYPFEIHIISVEYCGQVLSGMISSIYGKTIEALKLQPANDWLHRVSIYEEYLGGGYNIPTQESLAAISLAASREGLLLENTYTSKTFAAMIDLVRRKILPETEHACFIHTGGTPALFSQQIFLQTLIG